MWPELVGGAFQDGGLDPGVGDALGDVMDEHVDHRLFTVERCARPAVVEVEGHFVVGVEAGGCDDVDVRFRVDPLDTRDASTQADHGEVDDGVDPLCLELIQRLTASGTRCSSSNPDVSG